MPAEASGGMPSTPVTDSAGRQVRLSTSSVRSSAIGVMPGRNGNLSKTSSPSTSATLRACARRSAGTSTCRPSIRMRPVVSSSSRDSSCAQQAEARRHDPGGIAGMHAFLQHLDREVAAGQAAQRGRAPQLVVVAAARIQAHHQRRLADAVGEVVDVGRQVVAAGFLAGLDQDHAARVRRALLLQRLDRGERAEDRVAVVGAAAAVQPVALDHRLPRAQALVPAGHFRLLVEVAVQQHAVVAGARPSAPGSR